MNANDITRFWTKVNVRTPEECWLWTDSPHERYGKFWLDGGYESAHRVAWKIQHGPIPEGHGVLHRCDIKRCQNGAHLFTGTNATNMSDRNAKGRQARGESSPLAKLDKDQVLAIRSSEEPDEIEAKKHGVTCRAIERIRARQVWKHI